jgi:hypothetical protein
MIEGLARAITAANYIAKRIIAPGPSDCGYLTRSGTRLRVRCGSGFVLFTNRRFNFRLALTALLIRLLLVFLDARVVLT